MEPVCISSPQHLLPLAPTVPHMIPIDLSTEYDMIGSAQISPARLIEEELNKSSKYNSDWRQSASALITCSKANIEISK